VGRFSDAARQRFADASKRPALPEWTRGVYALVGGILCVLVVVALLRGPSPQSPLARPETPVATQPSLASPGRPPERDVVGPKAGVVELAQLGGTHVVAVPEAAVGVIERGVLERVRSLPGFPAPRIAGVTVISSSRLAVVLSVAVLPGPGRPPVETAGTAVRLAGGWAWRPGTGPGNARR
jgi:hypothetical protein